MKTKLYTLLMAFSYVAIQSIVSPEVSVMAQPGDVSINSRNVQQQVINGSNLRSVSNFSETTNNGQKQTSNQVTNNSQTNSTTTTTVLGPNPPRYTLLVTTNGIRSLQGKVSINGRVIPLDLRRTTIDVTTCVLSGNCNISLTGTYQPQRGVLFTRVTSTDGSLNNISQSGGTGKISQNMTLGVSR